MNKESILQEYTRWREFTAADPDTDPDIIAELAALSGDMEKIEDAFYRDWSLAPAGLGA